MAVKTKKHSRNRRRKSASAVPKDYWKHAARPVAFGGERFRATLINPSSRGHSDFRVTDQVQDFNWDDTSSELTGGLTFQQIPVHINITQQSKIRMEWAPLLRGHFERLWTMNCATPERNLMTQQWSMDLGTSLSKASESQDDYRFKKDKHHPRGWTADEVTRHVCAKVGIKIGRLAKCTHRITNLVKKDANPIDVIVLAYRAERRATGRRFFLTWDGKLNIDPLRRPENLLELAGAVIDATYRTTYKDGFATALTVRATTKKKGSKHKRHKFHVKVRSEKGVKTYGYVHKTIEAPNAHTEDEARRYGKQQLAKVMRPKQELSLTIPLMPTIRRGQAFRVHWKFAGLTQIVFVSQASHSVTPGQMQTTLTATFDDPYKDQQREQDAARRRAAARKRKRQQEDKPAPKGPTGRRGSRRRSAH